MDVASRSPPRPALRHRVADRLLDQLHLRLIQCPADRRQLPHHLRQNPRARVLSPVVALAMLSRKLGRDPIGHPVEQVLHPPLFGLAHRFRLGRSGPRGRVGADQGRITS